jgi:pSer/pThr/pTyr-binding forkhead associated (FHA) protein
MEITLKPVSHPELDDIVIVNGLFHVGRSEPPFSDYPEALIESLSRRHARIFMQDSTPYIADLGSSNGTNVNGKPLKEAPSQLQHGDLIDFSGDISFHVSLASEASDERTRLVKPPPSIHLSMSSQNTSVESSFVSEFPFLISKDSEVFSK